MTRSQDAALRRIPGQHPGRAWALIDPGSEKLLAGTFATEAEAKSAQRRLSGGRIELVEVYRG